MCDVFSDVLAQLEDQNAVLNQQLGVAKYWCQTLRTAVLQLAQELAHRRLGQSARVPLLPPLRRGRCCARPRPTHARTLAPASLSLPPPPYPCPSLLPIPSPKSDESVERCVQLAVTLPGFLVDAGFLTDDRSSAPRHSWLRLAPGSGPLGLSPAASSATMSQHLHPMGPYHGAGPVHAEDPRTPTESSGSSPVGGFPLHHNSGSGSGFFIGPDPAGGGDAPLAPNGWGVWAATPEQDAALYTGYGLGLGQGLGGAHQPWPGVGVQGGGGLSGGGTHAAAPAAAPAAADAPAPKKAKKKQGGGGSRPVSRARRASSPAPMLSSRHVPPASAGLPEEPPQPADAPQKGSPPLVPRGDGLPPRSGGCLGGGVGCTCVWVVGCVPGWWGGCGT
jgi:hypothetical protein